MGVYGEILYTLSDLNEILHRVCLKLSNDRGEFELDRAINKNYISEHLFALGHETDNTFWFVCSWVGFINLSQVRCRSHLTIGNKRVKRGKC